MTMTYASLGGRVTIPGSDIGIRARVKVLPLTTENVLKFPADDRITWGPAVGESNGSGEITPAIQVPTGHGVSGLLWRITVEPLDRSPHQNLPQSWVAGDFSITASTRLEDLVTVATTVVPATVNTTDASVANYINTGGSATRTAADAVYARKGSLGRTDLALGDAATKTVGAVNGVASLDGSGLVPDAQVPSTVARVATHGIKAASAVRTTTDLVPELAQTVEVNSPHLNSLAFDGFTLMTGTFPGGAIWVSYDKGLSWQSMGKPASDASVDDIAYIKAARPGVFYAGCSNSGGPSKLYKTTDSGATWTLAWTAPSAAAATEGLAVECVGRTVIIGGFNRVAGTNASIWRSTDDGATFTQVSTTSSSAITIRQIRHVYNSVYIAGVYSASPNQLDIYRSADNGATWAVTATLSGVDAYSAVALPNGGMLLGTHPGGKIYRSTNFGQTPYTQVADLGLGPGQSQVMGLTRVGNAILAFVNRNGNAEAKVYASGDNGTTWTTVATLDATYHYHEPVAVDARTIVATGTNNGGTGTRGVIYRMTWYG